MDDTECIICLEDLKSQDIAVLSCNHVVHFTCITNWMTRKNNYSEICPLCNNRGEIINVIEAQPVNFTKNNLSKTEIVIKNKRNKNENNEVKPFFFCCNIL